jgi:nucleoside phosphorylase
MKLGVVAALGRELLPTLQAFPSRPQEAMGFCTYWDSPPLCFAKGGMGVVRAERVARWLAEDAQGLLSVGFCGGLDDSLSPGQLILGGTPEFEASPSLLEIAKRAGPHRLGVVHTADHVVIHLEEKRRLARTTGAIAVEMEAAAVGRVARELGLPFLCIKVVLDTPSEPLASTYAGCFSTGLQILTRPWIIGRMLDDGKRAKRGAEKLRDFFVAFRKEISPSEG